MVSSYRVGWIHYTNAAPLLDYLQLPPHIEAITGVPTEINRALLEENVQLANISAIEFIRHADSLRALSGWSIAAAGEVRSVGVFHRKPLRDLKTIALTNQSAMSVALLKVLLREWNLAPRLVRVEGAAIPLLEEYDGVLRIGDDALQEWYYRPPDVQFTDLARGWWEQKKLPFTFAVWAYHVNSPPPSELLKCMEKARQYGLGHLWESAEKHAARLGLPQHIVQEYLWNLRYHLADIDREGLECFAKLAVPNHAPLIFE